MELNELITVGEVAGMLRVPSSWVYARTCEENHVGERLPHLKLGRHLRFRRAEVMRWVEGHHRGGKPSVNETDGRL
jgi:excisionase family DNA binding protein